MRGSKWAKFAEAIDEQFSDKIFAHFDLSPILTLFSQKKKKIKFRE